VYAVGVEGPGLDAWGVANLGRRPTFGEGEDTVEVHLFRFDGDLAGRRLRVSLFARLRPEHKFKDANELKLQIAEDARQARDLLDSIAGQKSP
jgi:riboflavin kinase/FMN adenylyltransferase